MAGVNQDSQVLPPPTCAINGMEIEELRKEEHNDWHFMFTCGAARRIYDPTQRNCQGVGPVVNVPNSTEIPRCGNSPSPSVVTKAMIPGNVGHVPGETKTLNIGSIEAEERRGNHSKGSKGYPGSRKMSTLRRGWDGKSETTRLSGEL
ncbi:uncharacterized protein EV420DRAFT_1484944 [Desarmillaria tabescens]|uniref:Uncharacterized protein n=1 Tax=Armillaria tabescens TaxID=1929756 RepID=A0AA39MQZ7_ARMTA|nr:uncharacterized protein EV420DRAFT_1484944 [Desarmillaria tabescens]KAK0443417.1 hypothetical protein EV420DRAFT_1484944 [Desarmillaria tabescens]